MKEEEFDKLTDKIMCAIRDNLIIQKYYSCNNEKIAEEIKAILTTAIGVTKK